MSTETPLTEYEQLQAHAALVARRILRTGENFSPHDIEQLARAWSLQAGEEIRANERLAAAQQEIERLREALRGIEKALRTDSRDKSIIGDEVEYHLDGQTMYLAINAARRALGEEG